MDQISLQQPPLRRLKTFVKLAALLLCALAIAMGVGHERFQLHSPSLGTALAALGAGIPSPPLSAPAVESFGVLQVESGARSARVYLDDKPCGKGALVRLDHVAPGLHKVSVRAPHHASFHRRIDIKAEYQTSLKIDLAPIRSPSLRRVEGPAAGTASLMAIMAHASAGSR